MPDFNPLPDDQDFFWGADGILRREVQPPPVPRTSPTAPSDTGARPDPADARRYPRIDLKLPILYKILSEEPTLASNAVRPFVTSESDNISPSGACLLLAEDLARGTVMALSIHLDNRQKVSAVGRVVWTQPTDTPHHCLIGLEFIVVYKKVRARTEYIDADVLKDLLSS